MKAFLIGVALVVVGTLASAALVNKSRTVRRIVGDL